jgi:hypothetical protein
VQHGIGDADRRGEPQRLDERLAVGAATLVERIACHGIGVGSGPAFVPAANLGWQQWSGDPGDGDPGVGDVLPCAVPDRGGRVSASDKPSARALGM